MTTYATLRLPPKPTISQRENSNFEFAIRTVGCYYCIADDQVLSIWMFNKLEQYSFLEVSLTSISMTVPFD